MQQPLPKFGGTFGFKRSDCGPGDVDFGPPNKIIERISISGFAKSESHHCGLRQWHAVPCGLRNHAEIGGRGG